MADNFVSRFVTNNDARSDQVIFPLPQQWWSRPYEYNWAATFAEPDDFALDAACGLFHPFRFLLAEHCHSVFACDLDPNIEKPEIIQQAIIDNFQSGPTDLVDKVQHAYATLLDLPYEDQKFDKIYCVSVLEHLPDWFNNWQPLSVLRGILPFARRDIEISLGEFVRVLKPGGLLVMTFDYPRVNIDYLQSLIRKMKLEFAGQTDFVLPDNAIYNEAAKLYCLRTVVRKTI